MHGIPTSNMIPLGTSESASFVGGEIVVVGVLSWYFWWSTGCDDDLSLDNFPPDDFVLVLIVSVDFFDLRVAVDVVLPLFRC